MEIGDKVYAIQSKDGNVVKSFGEGTYMGRLIPKDGAIFEEMEMSNPCIKLDSGKYVWGFECWWGEKDETLEKLDEEDDLVYETVEPNNIQPISAVDSMVNKFNALNEEDRKEFLERIS